MDLKKIRESMTIEEKISLTSGKSFWLTQDIPRLHIPSIKLSDGPHGVRCQLETADHLGINESIPSTCFPTASLLASTWDVELINQVGRCIATEAKSLGVNVVLGPGVNLKRNPLCGRNFEYFSEDPYLAGKLGAAWILGVESEGVGSSVKHFMGNNQENDRLRSNSLIDLRALHELYLRPFEIAIKEGNPATVMCAYNQVNGTYLSDHTLLLKTMLRDTWGYQGVVLTDWGALNHKVNALKATTDLEMPSSNKMFDTQVRDALLNGELHEDVLNQSVERILSLVKNYSPELALTSYDEQKHHQMAKHVAGEGAVLMKHEGSILPLKKGVKVALIGDLAEDFRYQGSGSSHIQPTHITSILDGFRKHDTSFKYCRGYDVKEQEANALNEETIVNSDVCVVVLGLPDTYESEGYDRTSMSLPPNQLELLMQLVEFQKPIVVVLVGGSPVDMSWDVHASAVLNLYLSGQAGGDSCVELLYGHVNPSGKLAETYPKSYEDVISSEIYGKNPRLAEYRESIFVGYRYYDAAKKEVAYPFGHGLSYTTFKLSNVQLNEMEVSFTVTNTGSVFGKQVVQCYVQCLEKDDLYVKQLAGFIKVALAPNDLQEVHITLDPRAFQKFDAKSLNWIDVEGAFYIYVGTSSRDIAETFKVQRKETTNVHSSGFRVVNWYATLKGYPSKEDFESLLGYPIESHQEVVKGNFTQMSTLEEMSGYWMVRLFILGMKRVLLKQSGGNPQSVEYHFLVSVTTKTPVIRLAQQSAQKALYKLFGFFVHMANGKRVKAIQHLLT